MSWKEICSAADVPTDTVRKFTAGDVPLVIANYGGAFRAMPPLCPHMEEPLEESGVIANCVMTCTKHLWSWNLETLAMEGSETEKDLKTYDTKEEGGKIFAYIEHELVYDFEEDGGEDDDDAFFSS